MSAPRRPGGHDRPEGTGGRTGGLSLSGGSRLGALSLQVDLEVGFGQTLAVVGPNGAGKSTLLRIIAGLVPLDTGRLVVAGSTWDDAAAGVGLAPEDRSVGLVFQDRLLFPHLSVLDNVAFGLRARGVDRARAQRRALDWLERVGLADRAGARPDELSGGQAQRVALARALVTEPAVVLLDEPLSALDADAHAGMIDLLADHLDHHHGVRLVVTHDPADAAALADRVLVLDRGEVAQLAAPDELEPTGYLARFLR